MSPLILSIAAFVGIAAFVWLVAQNVESRRDPLRRRLLAVKEGDAVPPVPGEEEIPESGVEVFVSRVLKHFGITNWHTPGVRTPKQRLIAVTLMGFGAGVGVVAFARLFSSWLHLPSVAVTALSFAGGWFGLWLTVRYWVGWHVRRWKDEINNNVIDVIDLWALCLGAGMSFSSALVRVTQDTELSAPALREELQLTNQEMLAGSPRDEALRHLVRRCGDSPDLRGLVSHIIQSEKLGSSLRDTLRIYAETLRFKRTQDTKELMQTLSVKLTFPLIFFILPALFVVILGPSMIQIYEMFIAH